VTERVKERKKQNSDKMRKVTDTNTRC